MHTMSIAKCREAISGASHEELASLLDTLEDDGRAGVQALVRAGRKRLERLRAERNRLAALFALEADLRATGLQVIAGVDEVGRGALAGPLTACAVALPPGVHLQGLNDSKLLTREHRSVLAEQIKSVAICWHVAHVEPERIDSHGMTAAVRSAMLQAVEGLSPAAEHVIIDGRPVGLGLGETAVIKGDSKVASIAAASIIAKVTRDDLMACYHHQYPQYGFCINRGYGTAEHLAAISEWGPTAIHRKSFSPCCDTPRLFQVD